MEFSVCATMVDYRGDPHGTIFKSYKRKEKSDATVEAIDDKTLLRLLQRSLKGQGHVDVVKVVERKIFRERDVVMLTCTIAPASSAYTINRVNQVLPFKERDPAPGIRRRRSIVPYAVPKPRTYRKSR